MANDIYRGQPVSGVRTNSTRTNATVSGSFDRDTLGDMLGGTASEPRLWDAIGYPSENELNFETYWTRYRRTAPAHGIIEKFPNDTWQDWPEIVDDSDTEGQTEFEEAVEDLFGQPDTYHSRESLRKTPKHWLRTADKMATLGEFSVILLGVNDSADPSEPIAGFDEGDIQRDVGEDGEDDGSAASKPFDGLDDLKFVGAFSQNEVKDFEVDTDITSDTFRLPESYEIEYTDEGDKDDFHYSRVIHVPEGVLTDPLRGTPGLLPIFHELLNIDKILAASAEGYWRGAYQGFVIKPPTNADGVPLHFIDGGESPQDSSELAQQINQYTDNFRRTITSTGDIEQLDASIASPQDHLEGQYRSISTAKDAPSSILMGNETGERATTEDREMWHEQIGGRRNNFAEPVILRPFIDRLIAIGVLPEPAGEGYDVEWPPLAEPSEAEEADIKNVLSTAIKNMSNGSPSELFTVAERRKILDYDPELGSEVDDDVDQPDLTEPGQAMPPDDLEAIEEQLQQGSSPPPDQQEEQFPAQSD